MKVTCFAILALAAASGAAAQDCDGRWTATDRTFTPRLGSWVYERREAEKPLIVYETLRYASFEDDSSICLTIKAPALEDADTEARVYLRRTYRTSWKQAGTDFTVAMQKSRYQSPGRIAIREVHGSFENNDQHAVAASQTLNMEPNAVNRIRIDLRGGKEIALIVNGEYAGTISGPPGDGTWSIALENETRLRDPALSVEGRRFTFEHVKITSR